MSEHPPVSRMPSQVSHPSVIIPPAPLYSRSWHGLAAELCQDPPGYFEILPRPEYIITFCLGQPIHAMQKRAGHTHHGQLIQGDVLITVADQPNIWHSDRSAHYLQLHLASSFLYQVVASLDACPPNQVEILDNFGTRDPVIEALGQQLLHELQYDQIGSRLYGESLAQVLAIHLLRRYSAANSSSSQPKGGLPQPLLRSVLEYIHDSLDQDPGLAELAALAGMSPSAFLKLFKQSMGLPPHQYLICCRVEQARQLLLQGDLTISEVAAMVGFCDQSHLTRHMKRLYGVTPKALWQPRRSFR